MVLLIIMNMVQVRIIQITLQNMLLLAPLNPDDDALTVEHKLVLVARYINILLTWRIWNFHSIAYSTMQYAIFRVMRDIRGLTPDELGPKLYDLLCKEKETFISNDCLYAHRQNRYLLHRILARLTDYIEVESGQPSRYAELVAIGPNHYEVEHILADHPERHMDEFDHVAEFAEHRNWIGGLVLVPKKFNASYGDLPYQEKLPHYLSQNLLVRSLHDQCYQHNPGFLQFINRSGLPFRSHSEFNKADIEERSVLYRRIAEQIWKPKDLLKEVLG